MKVNGSVLAVLMVIALTILATGFRISSAPTRIRMRLDTAKASCTHAGGQWVTVGREELCQAAAERK